MSDAAAAVAALNATAPAATQWFAGLDDVTKGTLQNTGLDKLEPVAAAAGAIKLFRDMQAKYGDSQNKLGLPAERVLRLPADATDEAGWKTVHQKLGVPDDPAGYDFSTIKAADGAALADDLVAFLRSTAAALAIPKDRAPKLAEALLARAAEGDARAASAAAIDNGQARLRLQQSWGPNLPGNKFVADRTAAMLALPPELMSLIEASPKYDTIMEGLRQAGERMGEASLIGGVGQAGQTRINTREQAAARIEELIKDADFYKRRMTPGDPGKAAREEWAHLHQLMIQR